MHDATKTSKPKEAGARKKGTRASPTKVTKKNKKWYEEIQKHNAEYVRNRKIDNMVESFNRTVDEDEGSGDSQEKAAKKRKRQKEIFASLAKLQHEEEFKNTKGSKRKPRGLAKRTSPVLQEEISEEEFISSVASDEDNDEIISVRSSEDDQENPPAKKKQRGDGATKKTLDTIHEDTSDDNDKKPRARKNLTNQSDQASNESIHEQTHQMQTRHRVREAKKRRSPEPPDEIQAPATQLQAEYQDEPEHENLENTDRIAILTQVGDLDMKTPDEILKEIEEQFEYLYDYRGSECADTTVEALNNLLSWLTSDDTPKLTIESFNPDKSANHD